MRPNGTTARLTATAAALAAATGCGIVESEPEQFLKVYDELEQPADARITIEASINGRPAVLQDEDLRSRKDPVEFMPHGRIGPLPRRGTLLTRVVVVRPPSDTIGVAELPYELGAERQYLLAVTIARSVYPWFGPVTWRSFPLRGSAAGSGDSLFVRYSNAVPCRGCVY